MVDDVLLVYWGFRSHFTFSVRALTGGHETNIEGGVAETGKGEMFGNVKIASSLKFDNHPVELSFKQVSHLKHFPTTIPWNSLLNRWVA